MSKENKYESIEIIELSAEDSLIVAEALLIPPKPSEALRRDFELYKKMVVSEEEDE